jgi:serine/threonine protein kinase
MASPPDDPRNVSRLLVELSGTVLEQRYELGRVLGSGEMGAVFEGRHLRLDRPVAIKVLRPGLAEHDEYVARFLREAKAASKIRHRNVAEILDYGEASAGLVYSVMELLVGQDLEQLLHAQPEERLPWARACELLVQITSGLEAAHGQGIIHRDIKPANCFLTEEDGEPVVKLVDFGIAKLEEGDQTHQLTATAQVLGTPSYIAPEIARTKSPASPRSDIYALGVLAYRMLTGRVPFTADTVSELLLRARFDPVPPMRALVPDLPRAVEELVLELLAKEPEQRPPDMLTVRQRLLMLSREMLEEEALEIPSFSALPLDAEISGPARSGASMRMTRDVMLGARWGGTALVELPVLGATTVELEPVPGESERPPRASEAPTAVLVASAEAPQPAVHDQPSSPPRSDATTPVVGEATQRSGETTSLDRSRGRGPRWIVLAGVAALAVIVGVAAFVLGDDGNEAAVEGNTANPDDGD